MYVLILPNVLCACCIYPVYALCLVYTVNVFFVPLLIMMFLWLHAALGIRRGWYLMWPVALLYLCSHYFRQ